MKRNLIVIAFLLAGILAGCGGSDPPQPVAVPIYSDAASDGDIAYDPVDITYTLAHADTTGSVLIGIDDQGTHVPEYAGFLEFPLDGSTGDGAIPSSAAIVSADLQIFVTSVSYASAVPVLLDLVDITGTPSTDFNSAPLSGKYQNLSFLATDAGNYVSIDVTLLMQEAQRLVLPRLQVRFLLNAASGLVALEDQSRVASTRPLLTVRYNP